MKNRHNFEFSPKTMLILLTVLCILLLSVSTVLKDVVKPLSAVAETVFQCRMELTLLESG